MLRFRKHCLFFNQSITITGPWTIGSNTSTCALFALIPSSNCAKILKNSELRDRKTVEIGVIPMYWREKRGGGGANDRTGPANPPRYLICCVVSSFFLFSLLLLLGWCCWSRCCYCNCCCCCCCCCWCRCCFYNICRVPGFEPKILRPQTGVLPMSYCTVYSVHSPLNFKMLKMFLFYHLLCPTCDLNA